MGRRSMATKGWVCAVAAALVGTTAATAHAASCATWGDVDGSGGVDVIDVQCAVLTTLWSLGGPGAALPHCVVASGVFAADLDCDHLVQVDDVQLAIGGALGIPLAAALDANGNACPDACEAPPEPCAQCDDGNPCTDDACGAQGCVFMPHPGACDDGDACTSDDTCLDGTCTGTPVVCGDDPDCQWERVCDPAVGCRYDSDAAWCDAPGADCQARFCFVPGLCGDGWCDDGESPASCPEDCPATCDGSDALCALSPWDVTWLGSHASTWVHPSPSITAGARQVLDVVHQVGAGVRYFDVAVAPCGLGDTALCVLDAQGAPSTPLADLVATLALEAVGAHGPAYHFPPEVQRVLLLRVAGAAPTQLEGIALLTVVRPPAGKPAASELHVAVGNLMARAVTVLALADNPDAPVFETQAPPAALPLVAPGACLDAAGIAPTAEAFYVVHHLRTFGTLASMDLAACLGAPAILAQQRDACLAEAARLPQVLLVDFARPASLPFAEAARNGAPLPAFGAAPPCALSLDMACPAGVSCAGAPATPGCVAQSWCAACTTTPDCPPATYCDVATEQCLPGRPAGAPCSDDAWCADAACADGYCKNCSPFQACPPGQVCLGGGLCAVPSPLGGPCTEDAQCTAGHCVLAGALEGTCLLCATDDACAAGTYCEPLEGCLPRLDAGAPCTQDHVCSSGTCVGGACASCGPWTDCPIPGTACTADGACVLQRPLHAPCTEDTQCRPGLVCRDAQCKVCGADADCGPGHYCEGETCHDKVGAGEYCTRAGWCWSNACEGSACASNCQEDADCPGGFYCATTQVQNLAGTFGPDPLTCTALTSGACTPLAPLGTVTCAGSQCATFDNDPSPLSTSKKLSACTKTCGSHADCAALGGYCLDDHCVPKRANGAPCSIDEACLGGVCVAGACSDCTTDADCLAAMHCDNEGSHRGCVDDAFFGEPCNEDPPLGVAKNVDCYEGYCSLAGTCSQCLFDAHCEASSYCDTVSHTCVPKAPNGAVCTLDTQCASGICDLMCVECSADADCAAGMYCDTPLGALNTCKPRMPLGGSCTADNQCISGACGEGACAAPCTADPDCPPTTFCEPFGKFCKTKFPNGVGVGCTADNQCLSGHCLLPALSCVVCESNTDCSATEYCSLNTCVSKKSTGAACLFDDECISGTCGEGVCATPCTADPDCPPTTFCEPFGKFCKDKFPNGVGVGCTADNQCTSGHCLEIALSCVECEANTDCANTDYCSLNSCLPQKPNGDPCTFNDECTGRACGEGHCATACNTDYGCPPTSFCEPDGKFCKTKFPNGFAVGCTADVQCQSGHCIEVALSCVECEVSPQCPLDHYCSLNTCLARKPNGAACTFDDECLGGKCGEGHCATACTADVECIPTTFCEPVGKFCKAKFPNGVGVGCTADNQCASGHCLEIALSCVDCETTPQCTPGNYCLLNACTPQKPHGAACTFDDECVGGRCGDGHCTTACTADVQCPPTTFCEPIAHFCKDKLPNGTAVGCLADNQCISGVCEEFTLSCVDCLQHSDCPPDHYCFFQLAEVNVCLFKSSAGMTCSSNVECLSNNCSCTGLFCTPVCQ